MKSMPSSGSFGTTESDDVVSRQAGKIMNSFQDEPESVAVETDKQNPIDEFILKVSDESHLQQEIISQVDKELSQKLDDIEKKRLEKVLKKKRQIQQEIDTLNDKISKHRGFTSAKEPMIKKLDALHRKLDEIENEEIQVQQRRSDAATNAASSSFIPMNSDASTRTSAGETEKERLIRTGKLMPFEQVGHSQTDELPHNHSDQENGAEGHVFLYKGDEWDDSENEISNECDEDEEYENSHRQANESKQSRYVDDGDEVSYQKRVKKWAEWRNQKRLDYIRKQDNDAPTDTTYDIKTESHRPCLIYPDHELSDGFVIPGDIYTHLFGYQKTCLRWLWELHKQEVGGIIGDEMGLGKTIQIISFLASLGYSKKIKGPILIICPATVLRQWVQEFHKWWPAYRVCILHDSGSGLNHHLSNADAENYDSYETDEMEFTSDEDSEDGGLKRRGKFRKTTGGRKSVSSSSSKMASFAKQLVERIRKDGHVIVTTYAAIRMHSRTLLSVPWSYCVLDEGHQIRNPDAEITILCKRLRTSHRIILTGTPIQNNLKELWSLYDFVFPGRLGTLPVFQAQFAVPINLGGYVNATNIQVQTAFKCACVLRDLISPYLLRRLKADVASDLPEKTEQVLFCKLTDYQREEYQKFLSSKQCASILKGAMHVLAGIDVLRKICNHPDLLSEDAVSNNNSDLASKSGKLMVVKTLLSLWKSQGHKVLLFSQTRQMLDILERFVRGQGYNYQRMDGATLIRDRARLVDRFNESEEIFVFLLTTKVGGLGINLTGANRIIIYDPDWNPSTDTQARERAWRLGQKKSVTIYRLMTSGTIEEKIYHRQIFKQFLTNKILKDPRQRRFFKSNDLHDLFTLGGKDDVIPETGEIFSNTLVQADPKSSSVIQELHEKKKRRKRIIQSITGDDEEAELCSMEFVANVNDFEENPGDGHDGDAQPTMNTDANESSLGEDERILQSLFATAGVHSALKHDEIMEAANPEAILVEKEAKKVADDAIAALKQSRKEIKEMKRLQQNRHLPTWTGRNGLGGAPVPMKPTNSSSGLSSSSRLSFGSGKLSGFHSLESRPGTLSSSSILSQLRDRAPVSSTQDSSSSSSSSDIRSSRTAAITSRLGTESQAAGSKPGMTTPGTKGEALIFKIQNFLAQQGGSATTADIMNAFKMKISADEVPTFRKMLQGIASFQKTEVNPKGCWTLREEFQ